MLTRTGVEELLLWGNIVPTNLQKELAENIKEKWRGQGGTPLDGKTVKELCNKFMVYKQMAEFAK